MRYQRAVWHHEFDDEPVVLFSEIGSDSYERRKVDEYRDGALDYADGPRDPVRACEGSGARRRSVAGRADKVGLREQLLAVLCARTGGDHRRLAEKID